MNSASRWDIFCAVVDNYGDIAVCWRLARQLVAGYQVTLWVDELPDFQQICREVNPALAWQTCFGVEVRHWSDCLPQDVPVADVVIEAFACELPPAYVQAMAARASAAAGDLNAPPGSGTSSPAESAFAPIWINLDYLSAEAWVEGCHELVSVHPQLGLKKFFFFPGFTERTGGLLVEPQLALERARFQAQAQMAQDFFQEIELITVAGVSAQELAAACKVSLFCYPSAPVESLLAAWSASGSIAIKPGQDAASTTPPLICFVPFGVADAAVEAWAAGGAERISPPGASVPPVTFTSSRSSTSPPFALRRGALTVVRIPFMSQDQYDRLLWACDLNFVRGEDSFVRAQLAARPMVWQIYPQEEQAHLEKLAAFMQQYQVGMTAEQAERMNSLWLHWNKAADEGESQAEDWSVIYKNLPNWQRYAQEWCRKISEKKSLAQSLCQFIQKIS